MKKYLLCSWNVLSFSSICSQEDIWNACSAKAFSWNSFPIFSKHDNMTTRACWDFIAGHGLVLQSSLFILQVLQIWHHTYAEKNTHWIKSLFFFLTVSSLLVLVPRNTYFSAHQRNKIVSHQLVQQWSEGSSVMAALLVSLHSRMCQPQEYLGRCLDLLARGLEMGSSVTSGTQCWNINCLGPSWIFWLLNLFCFILFCFILFCYYLLFEM